SSTPLDSFQHPLYMDLEALMESAQEAMTIVNILTRAVRSNHKRQRLEGESSNVREKTKFGLVRYRPTRYKPSSHRYMGKDQYPFPPLLIQQKQDSGLFLKLKKFVYPLSSSEAWKAKYQVSAARQKELNKRVWHLKTLEKQHLADKEQIQEESNMALKKFVANTNKGIEAHLLVLSLSSKLTLASTSQISRGMYGRNSKRNRRSPMNSSITMIQTRPTQIPQMVMPEHPVVPPPFQPNKKLMLRGKRAQRK
ncbi:hypothetical protein J1N35_034592, partial [Gossypium stocksii]